MPPAAPHFSSRSAAASAAMAAPGASSADASRSKTKAAPMGDKVVIRRLPPAMTREEFQTILGPVWRQGNGKVGWFSFEAGKISKDPSKPPRPSRAYLQVLRKDDLFALSEAVRVGSWEDEAGSFTHAGYIGPAKAEFSIYKKIPNPGKRKADARQGTIDQDAEFMSFLEKLANPYNKADENTSDKADDVNVTATEITTTPLIEAIREKKAAKARDAANAKNAKQLQVAAAKDKKKKDRERDKKGDKPKGVVKILTKKAAAQEAAAGAAKTAASKIASSQSYSLGSQQSQSEADNATHKSRRAGIAAAARLLQRDLGISPGSAHRRARLDAQKVEADVKVITKETRPASPKPEPAPAKKTGLGRPLTPTAPKAQQQAQQQAAQQQASQQQSKRGKGKQRESGRGKTTAASTANITPAPTVPITILKKDKKKDMQPAAAHPGSSSIPPTPSAATASISAAVPPPSAPTGPKAGSKKGNTSKVVAKKSSVHVTANAIRAFVKHANPSQGVTESLLKASLEVFGTITFVEIDRRKGFAHVDFADHEGLVRAITASPISVAQGTVQVLERRDKPNPPRAGGGQTAAGERGGGKSSKNERDADSKAKVKENQAPDGGSNKTAVNPSGVNLKADGVAAGSGAGAGAGGGGGGGKPKVRRGGRGRGARGKDGAGNSNAQQASQQPNAAAG